MFVFEILNILMFIVYCIGVAIVFWLVSKNTNMDGIWRAYAIVLVISAVYNFNSFFTLTEEQHTIDHQHTMMRQSSQIHNDSELDKYLEKNTKKELTATERRDKFNAELEQEQNRTKETVKQSFEEGNK